VYDTLWVEHLEVMQYTRSSVSLRAYGQQDPLIEYRKEGTRLFAEMEEVALARIAELIPRLENRLVQKEEEELRRQQAQAQRSGGAQSASTGSKAQQTATKRHAYGRNDMVTITNGTDTKELKYKKAEALLQTGEWKIVEEK